MNFESVRPSFYVVIVGKNPNQNDVVYRALSTMGFRCRTYIDEKVALVEAKQDPPHVLFTFIKSQDSLDFVDQAIQLLPELHVVALMPENTQMSVSDLYKKGIFDCLDFPTPNVIELVKAADRAVQVEFFRYQSEQVEDESRQREMRLQGEIDRTLQQLEDKDETLKMMMQNQSENSFALLDVWLGQLTSLKDTRTVIDHFMKEVVRGDQEQEILFFRYVPSKKSLVVSQAVTTNDEEFARLGFELNQGDKPIDLRELQVVDNHGPVFNTLKSICKTSSLSWMPLWLGDEFSGLFVMFSKGETPSLTPYRKICLRATKSQLEKLRSQKEVFDLTRTDGVTGVLNRHNFFEGVRQEFSRARRISLPVSLLVLSIDNYKHFANGQKLTDDESASLLKSFVKIIQKYSRVNDIVGRIGAGDFGILLPHTDKVGASIKAERLRRIIESADFSSVAPLDIELTVSLGVSEYPSLCQDADQLFETADRALQNVQKSGLNKVSISAAPDNFVPDFIFERQHDSTI